MLLTPKFIKRHARELITPLFEYQVEDKYKSWTYLER
jgi:hypothetical protein